ncbi:unnamed protein product [Durusdinium trenchii]|uniref:Uncharacterized protein n=1 Tax=Durusdinium trenchii TaxID=1381693 RepID=A0ABP0J3U3_9DINO
MLGASRRQAQARRRGSALSLGVARIVLILATTMTFATTSWSFTPRPTGGVGLQAVRRPVRMGHARAGRRWAREESRIARPGLGELLPLCVAVAPALAYQLVGPEDGRRARVAPPAATESHDILDSIIRVGLQPDLLLRLRKPLTFLNFISAAVFIFHFYFLPGGSLVLPIEPFVACTFFLGILLAHRVTRATERFQRGQQAWSDLVNVTRNLNRQSHVWADRESFMVFSHWLPAFPAALLWDLRKLEEEELELVLQRSKGPGSFEAFDGGITEREIAQVLTRPPGMSAASFVLRKLQVSASKLKLPEGEDAVMQDALTQLSEAAETCESSRDEAVPEILQESARWLFLWLAVLPFILPTQLQVGVVLAQQVLAFGLLGIEDVAIQLEEPFVLLPMEGPCSALAKECQALRSNWRRMRKGSEPRKMPATPRKYPVLFPRHDRIYPCYEDESKPGEDDEVILL